MRTIRIKRPRYIAGSVVVLVVLLALIAAACGGGEASEEEPAETTLQQPEPVIQTIVQVVNPEAQAPAGQAPSGWDTKWSQKIDFHLLSTDPSSSEGDSAWDVGVHPEVYFATAGPGYSGLLSEKATLPGLVVIDTVTKEVVAYQSYDLGAESYFEPHGLGVSPDGKFVYLPTGVSAGFSDVGTGRWLVIDARTLKINKIIATPTAPHHAKAYTDVDGNQRVMINTFRGQFAVLDPRDDNKVVGSFTNADLTASGYLAFADTTGKYIFVSIRPPRGMETDGGVAVVDTKTWRVVRSISTEDSSPIWVEFTADGKYAFVSGGHHSNIAKIHIEGPPPEWELVGLTQAGTAGPYGIRLNWDETQLWASGKGEGSHNKGMTIGLADPVRMPRSWGTPGEWYTGCLRNDHGTLNPSDTSELWLSCNSSFETVIWDMEKKEVKERIPMPLGASTHSGSIVRYTPDFTGELLSDQNGLHGSAFQQKLDILAATVKN